MSRSAPTDGCTVCTRELLAFCHGIAADGELLHLTSQYGDVKTYDRERRTVRMRATGLDQPLGLAVRTDGSLVVAEAGTGRILSIEENGAAGTVTVLAEGFGRPVDVALDAEGRCYVSDELHGTLSRVEKGAAVSLVDGLAAPHGLVRTR